MRSGRGIPFLVVALCACGVAVGQPGRIIYVDGAAVGANDGSSWPDAYVYLQDALGEAITAAPPVEVRVAQGLYKPDQGAGIVRGDEDAAFELLNGVTLEGGYAAGGGDPDARDVDAYTTILSGDLDGDDTDYLNSDRVVVGSATDATAVIDGFKIAAGLREGMLVEGGTPTIRDCAFEGNGLRGLYGEESRDLTLTNCRFIGGGSAGISAWDCHLILINCVFEQNGWFAQGAGIKCSGNRGLSLDHRPSHLELSNCVFRDNERGIDTVGTLDLRGCLFTGNGGSAVFCSGNVTARKCTFSTNVGSRAGAIRCWEDPMRPDAVFDCTLVDCEFVGNLGGHAGAVLASGDSLTATGCVFVGNAGFGRHCRPARHFRSGSDRQWCNCHATVQLSLCGEPVLG